METSRGESSVCELVLSIQALFVVSRWEEGCVSRSLVRKKNGEKCQNGVEPEREVIATRILLLQRNERLTVERNEEKNLNASTASQPHTQKTRTPGKRRRSSEKRKGNHKTCSQGGTCKKAKKREKKNKQKERRQNDATLSKKKSGGRSCDF